MRTEQDRALSLVEHQSHAVKWLRGLGPNNPEVQVQLYLSGSYREMVHFSHSHISKKEEKVI